MFLLLFVTIVFINVKELIDMEHCIMCYPFIWLFQVVWQPYEVELARLPAFCVAGRDVWTARVPLVCFWLVEKHTPDRVVRQFGMVQEIPPNVDIDEALHAIDLRRKMAVNWRDKHYGHIQVWNSRARSLCHGARLRVICRLLIHTSIGTVG